VEAVFFFFFFHNFYVENLANFAHVKTKFVKITLEKHIFSNFLTLEKKVKIQSKKKTLVNEGSYNHSSRVRSILCLNRAHKIAYMKDPSHS
jgi:hypothetical protein